MSIETKAKTTNDIYVMSVVYSSMSKEPVDGLEKWVPLVDAQQEIAKIIIEGSVYNGELLDKIRSLEAKLEAAKQVLAEEKVGCSFEELAVFNAQLIDRARMALECSTSEEAIENLKKQQCREL